jgi:hypothetical protein
MAVLDFSSYIVATNTQLSAIHAKMYFSPRLKMRGSATTVMDGIFRKAPSSTEMPSLSLPWFNKATLRLFASCGMVSKTKRIALDHAYNCSLYMLVLTRRFFLASLQELYRLFPVSKKGCLKNEVTSLYVLFRPFFPFQDLQMTRRGAQITNLKVNRSQSRS